MPGQRCSRTPTHRDTEAAALLARKPSASHFLQPGTTHSGLSWDSSPLPGVGRSHQRAQPSPKSEGKQEGRRQVPQSA